MSTAEFGNNHIQYCMRGVDNIGNVKNSHNLQTCLLYSNAGQKVTALSCSQHVLKDTIKIEKLVFFVICNALYGTF